MMAQRRSVLASMAGTAAVGLAGWEMSQSQASVAAASKALSGAITGNDPVGLTRFSTWLGHAPDLTMLYFNQARPSEFISSVPYIVGLGPKFAAVGSQVVWSVPFPGPRQLENVLAGAFDGTYKTLFWQLATIVPGTGPILLRLPWEFNLAYQGNAAIDQTGAWNPGLFVKAWQKLATMARNVSWRFQRIWCPNVTTMALDPQLCWPGSAYVEIIAQDYYMQSAYNHPGDFNWFLTQARGLRWGAKFAAANGKPYGLSEWGMDDDRFAPDLMQAIAWFKGLGALAHHQLWWDRPEEIDCRISNGLRPALGADFRTSFA